MTLQLETEKRDGKSAQALRKAGSIPAVVYGPKKEAEAIAINAIVFEKLFKEAGESTVVQLTGGTTADTLIHDVQFDPVSGKAIHADFYAVVKGQKVQVHVPIEFTGESEAVKTLGGQLVKVLHEIEVEAEAAHLPHEIVVDITPLVALDSQIYVRDIKAPAGVSILNDPDEVIILVDEAKEEVEETPAAIDMSAIEVEKKGKTEEEAAAAE